MRRSFAVQVHKELPKVMTTTTYEAQSEAIAITKRDTMLDFTVPPLTFSVHYIRSYFCVISI